MPITNKRFNKDFKKKRVVHSRHVKTMNMIKELKKDPNSLLYDGENT